MNDFHLARRSELPTGVRYAPAAGVGITPATTLTILQSAGVNIADVTFVFPPSGKVIAEIELWVYSNGGPNTTLDAIGYLGLMEGATARMNKRCIETWEKGGTKRAVDVLTGTPGSIHTYSLAAAQSVASEMVIATDADDGNPVVVTITPCL